LIDLYRSAFGPRPLPLAEAVVECDTSCGLAAWNALPQVERLLAAARQARIPIVHTNNNRARALAPWYHKPESRMTLEDGHGAADPDPIMPSLTPGPDELLIRKASASAFWGSPLVGHLVGLGVDTVIVCGESTSGCVRASVVDGCTWRFRMIVAEECVFDRHEASHAINLFDMNQKYADVLALDEILAYLDKIS
jgi:nicotinamidase-related amidase